MSEVTYERGIDKLEVGQLMILNFPSPLKRFNTSIPEEKEKFKEHLNNGARIPAVILEKKQVGINFGDWSYTVGFWTRWGSGAISGLLVIKDCAVWRYFQKEFQRQDGEPTEGWIPDDILETIKELETHGENYIDKSYGIANSQLFYVENSNEDDDLVVRRYVINQDQNKIKLKE